MNFKIDCDIAMTHHIVRDSSYIYIPCLRNRLAWIVRWRWIVLEGLLFMR
jgi:hypothetical protein